MSAKMPLRSIPSLPNRMAAGRPVLAQRQVTELTERVMGMTSADTVYVIVSHTARVVTRMANGQVLSGDDGDELEIFIGTKFGNRNGVKVTTNQLDDSSLRAMVQHGERLAREGIGPVDSSVAEERQEPDQLIPVQLWHEETIRAMSTTRGTVIPELLGAIAHEQLRAAGFLGIMARSEALITKEGIAVYSEETDCEITVTARTADGKSSGWGGQAARNWTAVKYADVAAHAARMAKLGVDPVALEPGRRVAILGAPAVAQITRFMAQQFNAASTDRGMTALSKLPYGNKLRMRVLDPRIDMSSDPADADGGYRPYFSSGNGTKAMTWVENGVLKNLAYDPLYAMVKGKPYAEDPYSLRIAGGPTSVDQMVAQCKEGVYVNRLSAVEMVDQRTALMTGVMRDGCFLVKNGQIERGLKNFRFLDSPFFFMNSIEAIGPTARAPFGYTPRAAGESWFTDWPRRPMIVPPMMVRDFNFNALADAV